MPWIVRLSPIDNEPVFLISPAISKLHVGLIIPIPILFVSDIILMYWSDLIFPVESTYIKEFDVKSSGLLNGNFNPSSTIILPLICNVALGSAIPIPILPLLNIVIILTSS